MRVLDVEAKPHMASAEKLGLLVFRDILQLLL